MRLETDFMIKNKIFNVKTKSGSIIKIAREHYLRDDLSCGSQICKKCPIVLHLMRLTNSPISNCSLNYVHYIIPDTNVLLHQLSLFETEWAQNVIILQTVLEEVKALNFSAYKRVCDLLKNSDRKFYSFINEHHIETYTEQMPQESINDRNDRAIRNVVKWYNRHLNNMVRTILITNDKENLQKAINEDLQAYNLIDYLSFYENKQSLMDKLSTISSKDNLDNDIHDKNNDILFPEHLPLSTLQVGLKSGKYFQGSFIASRNNFLEADVGLLDTQEMIFIKGLKNMNRSVNQDIVAVEIFPEDQWVEPSNLLLENEADLENDDIMVPEDTNETTLKTKSNPKIPRRKTGRVVGIIKRKWRPLCGVLQKSSAPWDRSDTTWYTFVPADARVPFVKVQLGPQLASTLVDQRIVVCIDTWPRRTRYPRGHYVKTLGRLGDKETENEVLLTEHDIIHDEYPEEALKCLPTMPWQILPKDFEERRDLREVCIFSIDPVGCTDVDDALHCIPLDNGNFEVGVHIADVSHFIKENTALDREAQNRGTTVYLVDKRIDMVPELLSSNLCSLLANVDRLAFSVVWEIEVDTGNIVRTHFTKSVIRSKAKLTYAEAQNIINAYAGRGTTPNSDWISSLSPFSNDPDLIQNRRLLADIAIGATHLDGIAKKLKQKRLDRGALVLASSELKFLMDSETNEPVTMSPKETFDTNSLVEEFMLLANISVARVIYENFPACAILRRHQSPPLSNFDPLLKAASTLDITLDIDDGKALAESLDRAERAQTSPEEGESTEKTTPYSATLLRILTARCMMEALYFCSGTLPFPDFSHYGLATEIYTHFTSPIRRYADIMVHRLLAAYVDAQPVTPQMLDKNKIQIICNHINLRNRNARNAQRASVELQIQLYFKDKVVDEEAYIIGIRRNAIRVLVPKFGIEGSIYLKSTSNQGLKTEDKTLSDTDLETVHNLKYDEETGSLTYANRLTLKTFDKIRVQLSMLLQKMQNYRLSIRLLEPRVPGFEPQKELQELIMEHTNREEMDGDFNVPDTKRIKKIK